MSCSDDSKDQLSELNVSEIKIEGIEDWMISEVTGPNGQICGSQQVLETVLQKYTHIANNIFKGGANGKIASEYMICDCRYDICKLGLILATDHPEMACGSRAGCINRELAIECPPDDCPCGSYCKNRRFQEKSYASLQIFNTGNKGLGLKARERIEKYIALIKGSYIDASKKGNVSRFMNHSCNPNCALQKWVVGNQIRIGIFAIKDIPIGTELTFDYQFEVYGAAAQKCHCGEENCVGYIGKGNSLTVVSEEDLMDDEVDNKKINEIAPVKPLSTVEQVQELVKYIMINLSDRHKVIRSMNRLLGTDISLLRKFIYYRGLILIERCLDQHMNSKSNTVRFYILQVLKLLPITAKNGIVNIEQHVEKMTDENAYGEVLSQLAKQIIENWASLEMVYKIPKKVKVEGENAQRDSPADSDADRARKRPRSPERKRSPISNRPSPFGSYRGSEDSYSDSRYRDDRDKRSSFYESKNLGNYEERKITISNVNIPHLRWNVANLNPPSSVETSSVSLSAQTETASFVDMPAATVDEMVEAAQEEIRRKEELERKQQEEAEELRKKAKAAKKQKIQEHRQKLKAVVEPKPKHKHRDAPIEEEISTEERINLKSQISVIVIKVMSRYKEKMDSDSFKEKAKAITKALLEKELRSRNEKGKKQTVFDEKYTKAIKKYIIDYLTRHGIVTNK
ncbi:histone methyltransferase set2 [Boothiomyces sp. JEL0838]|nr:histone methyltransferase set2 [Boothiomyces sp. JEL0838]